MAAVAHEGALWVVGGAGPASDDELRQLLRYEPEADAWESLASMGANREHLSAVSFDGRLVALAGRDGDFFASTEVYDEPGKDERSGSRARLVR